MTDAALPFMDLALEQARLGAARGEVPVGAVLVDGASGEVLARAHNRVEALNDPTAHAEMLVIREVAGRLAMKRLPGFDLYVTLEPCAMCATAVSFARLRCLTFGASDPKGGGVLHGGRIYDHPTCHHRPEVVRGPREAEAAEILKDFFRHRR